MAAEAFTGSAVSSSFATGTFSEARYFTNLTSTNGFALVVNPTTNLYTCSKSGVTVFSNYNKDQVASLWHLLAHFCSN